MGYGYELGLCIRVQDCSGSDDYIQIEEDFGLDLDDDGMI